MLFKVKLVGKNAGKKLLSFFKKKLKKISFFFIVWYNEGSEEGRLDLYPIIKYE